MYDNVPQRITNIEMFKMFVMSHKMFVTIVTSQNEHLLEVNS